MSVCKKIVVYFIIITCLIASAGRILRALTTYLCYGTETQTIYTETTSLPGITFCGPKAQFISDKYYEHRFGHSLDRPLNNSEERHLIEEYLSQKSVKEQLKDLVSVNDMKQWIKWQILNNGERSTPDHQLLDLRISLSSDLFCITYEHGHHHKFTWNTIAEKVSFELNLNISEIIVITHPLNEALYDMNALRYELVSLESQSVTNIYYETTHVLSLSAPYETKCRNYDSKGHIYSTRLQECLIDSKMSCWPDHYLIVDRLNTTLKFCSQSELDKNGHSMERAKYLCKHHLGTMCSKEYFTLKQNKVLTQNSKNFKVINILSAAQHKRITYNPVMVASDVMMDLLNVVCLWLAAIAVYLLGIIRVNSALTRVHNFK